MATVTNNSTFIEYASQSSAKQSIARFHDGHFQSAYIPGCHGQDQSLHTNRPVLADHVPFQNGWFGPLYGIDNQPVAVGIHSCPFHGPYNYKTLGCCINS